jgi:hypothetical protein
LAAECNAAPNGFDAQVHSTLERLKDAPPEAAAELILTGLRLARQEQSWATHVLQREFGNVLRRKPHFTEDQVVEMTEQVPVQPMEFPFKGVLKAAESLPMTSRLAHALACLRPSIGFRGIVEGRDLQARLDALFSGPAPDTSLEVQGAWSQGAHLLSRRRTQIERGVEEVAYRRTAIGRRTWPRCFS